MIYCVFKITGQQTLPGKGSISRITMPITEPIGTVRAHSRAEAETKARKRWDLTGCRITLIES